MFQKYKEDINVDEEDMSINVLSNVLSPTREKMIKVEHICKVYQSDKEKKVALSDVTLGFDKKGFVFINGISGSGKTTLMNIISGLDHSTSGKVYYDAQEMQIADENKWSWYRNTQIGIVFQNYNLIEDIGVFVFATQHPCFVTLTDKYMTPHSYYDIAIEGQPQKQCYYHRSLQDIFEICFRHGFIIDGFYEACFGNDRETISSWSKRFDVKNDDLIKFTGKAKHRVDLGAGYFKNYHIPVVLKSVKTLTFYVRGDMERIKYLLENYIFYLGKKPSQGYGEVRFWEFEEIEDDISVLNKENKNMRNIPYEEVYDILKENASNIRDFTFNLKKMPVIPPYWRPDYKEVCII